MRAQGAQIEILHGFPLTSCKSGGDLAYAQIVAENERLKAELQMQASQIEQHSRSVVSEDTAERVMHLQSSLDAHIEAGKEMSQQFLRLHRAFYAGTDREITDSDDCRVLADELIERQRTLVSQLQREKSANQKLEQAVQCLSKQNAEMLQEAKRARRHKQQLQHGSG